MRRITAAGLSALALCAVIGTTAGTANADATVGYGVLAGTAGQAGPPAVGKKHNFHTSIAGSDVRGTWYWAKKGGKKDVWLSTTIRHTKADRLQAALCYKMTGMLGSFCLSTSTKSGANRSDAGFVNATAKTHFYIQAAEGHSDPKAHTFNVTKSGPWVKLF